MLKRYDLLYQEWLKAIEDTNYAEADKLREEFERIHGLTIFAKGLMPIEGQTVRRMKASAWEKKYGNPRVARIIEAQDSLITSKYPTYGGLKRYV